MVMLARVVEYLHSHNVPFRLLSFPSVEPEPPVVFPIRPAGLAVQTRVLLVDGRPIIAAVPSGDRLNLPGIRAELNARIVEEGSMEDLPWPFGGAGSPLPPFARLFGMPLFIDEAIGNAAVLCLMAFAPTDFIEITYDDYLRLEQPRVGKIAEAGELPPPPLH
jgi:hypothetical protein